MSLIVRSDFTQKMKADMGKWGMEIEADLFKKTPPKQMYKKLAEVGGMNDAGRMSGFFKETSAIGASEFKDVDDYGELQEDNPLEGFTVYGKIKQKGLTLSVPYETNRDMNTGIKKIQDFCKHYVVKAWKSAEEYTKERIVATFLNRGGYTSGDSFYNNDDASIGLTTYTSPNLQYDGKPVFNKSDNTRSAKNAATYYNMLVNGANPNPTLEDVGIPMFNLLTDTNAYMENGNEFDNTEGIIIVCPQSIVTKWDQVINSTLTPDNANNALNPLKSRVKEIISYPYFSSAVKTAKGAIMMRQAIGGIVYKLSDTKYDFWYDHEKRRYRASAWFDFAIYLKNFRPMVAWNFPTSA